MGRRVYTGTAKHQIHVVFDHRQQCRQTAAPASVVESARETEGPLKACLDQLDELVGLTKVKEFVTEIYAWLEVSKRRQAAGLATDQQVLHMIFAGEPGTGKTTVARIIGKLFKEMGVLSKGHLIEVERADLVGEYIGHTAQKTRDHVRRALGGILFIDEAYSLARGGDKDFGKEAIDTLVKSMEDHKNDFILILAGYSHEMGQFLRLNPGLPSRFPIQLTFPPFTLAELMEIADNMVREREYRLSFAFKEKLKKHLQEERLRNRNHFGNARHVRNLIEQAARHQAVRLLRAKHASRDDLMTLRSEDLQIESGSQNGFKASWYNEKIHDSLTV